MSTEIKTKSKRILKDQKIFLEKFEKQRLK